MTDSITALLSDDASSLLKRRLVALNFRLQGLDDPRDSTWGTRSGSSRMMFLKLDFLESYDNESPYS